MADASPVRIELVKEAGREKLSRYISSPELSAIPNLNLWVLDMEISQIGRRNMVSGSLQLLGQ